MKMTISKIINEVTMRYEFDGVLLTLGDFSEILYFDEKYRKPVNIDMQKYEEEEWYKNIIEIIIYNLPRITYQAKEIKICDEILV